MAMFAPTIRRSLLEARTSLPPTFLLPFRAHITTVSHTLETGNIPEPLIQSGQHVSQNMKEKLAQTPQLSPSAPPPAPPAGRIAHARQDLVTSEITPEIRRLLPILQSQPAHYFTIHIHGHPYLVTRGDTIRLPFLMPKVVPGDILRLNRATHIGSRDYTLKAPEPQKGTRDGPKQVYYLDERLFTVRARVLGVESEPMRIMEKTKRRQRHVKHVFSKHRYTILKIAEAEIKGLEEYEASLAESKGEVLPVEN